MYCLSDEQITYILNDIRRNGIETEDLQLNLLDHICCIIEHNLKGDDEFEGFYKDTIKQFYKSELKEIEVETINLLMFKNYYTMKKVMIASGVLSITTFVLGSFLKILHLQGAAALLLLGIIITSFLFLPLLLLLKIKEVATMRDRLIMILGTICGMLYFISMLFQIEHWEGRSTILLCTLAISFFIFIPAYFFTGLRRPETRVNTIVSTIILIAVIGLQFTMTSLNVPSQVDLTNTSINR